MEKHYQIQCKFTDDGEKWVDRIGSKYDYTEDGLGKAITDIRYLTNLHRTGSKVEYRLVCQTTEVMDIYL